MNQTDKGPEIELTTEGPHGISIRGVGVTTDSSEYFKTDAELRENQSKRTKCEVCRGRFRDGCVNTLSPPGGRIDVCIACLPNPPEEWI